MTMRGAEALRAELKRLKSEARPNIIKAIAEARGHGDLSENAEYHAAREQQGFIEGRIKEIERKLASAEVIDKASAVATLTGTALFEGAVFDKPGFRWGRMEFEVVDTVYPFQPSRYASSFNRV